MLRLFDRGRRQRELQAALDRARRDALSEALSVFEAWQSAQDFDTVHTTLDDASRARAAYDQTPLLNAAVETVISLAVGDGVTYGDLDDRTAYDALEAWHQLNDVEQLSKEMLRDWLLDGVLLPVIADDAPPSQPAWVNLWDTVTYPVEVKATRGNPRDVTGVRLPREQRAEVGIEAFALRRNRPATRTVTDSVLGVSPLAPAVNPSLAHARLLELRLRLHEIRGRLNAVYYAFASSQEELQAAAARFKNMPRDGRLLTLWRDRNTGQSEQLELLTAKAEGADAEADVRGYIRTVASVAGIPEHYLAVSDTGNRATGEAMAEPMVRRIESLQQLIVGVLTELFRKELVRRFGKDRLYTMTVVEVDGLKRTKRTIQVPAHLLTIPFDAPPVRNTDTDTSRVISALDKGLISNQTATAELGFDPALEAELKSNESGGGDGESGGAFDEDAQNQQRILNASRLATEANEQDPGVGLHWAHIITAPGAATAPGAYLGAAMGRAAPEPAEPDEGPEQPPEPPPAPPPTPPQPEEPEGDPDAPNLDA